MSCSANSLPLTRRWKLALSISQHRRARGGRLLPCWLGQLRHRPARQWCQRRNALSIFDGLNLLLNFGPSLLVWSFSLELLKVLDRHSRRQMRLCLVTKSPLWLRFFQHRFAVLNLPFLV